MSEDRPLYPCVFAHISPLSSGGSARPAYCSGTGGGGTSFVEAGLRVTSPAACRYEKKERTTESFYATVAGLRPSRMSRSR